MPLRAIDKTSSTTSLIDDTPTFMTDEPLSTLTTSWSYEMIKVLMFSCGAPSSYFIHCKCNSLQAMAEMQLDFMIKSQNAGHG